MRRLTVEVQPTDGQDHETVLDIDLADVVDVLDIGGGPLEWTWHLGGAVMRLTIADTPAEADG